MQVSDIELFLSTESKDVGSRFDRVFKSSLAKQIGDHPFLEKQDWYWEASAFGLDRVREYNDLSANEKNFVLARCSDDLLREACFVEIAGLSYTARMSLDSSRLEERLFYSMMAADEAKHFSLLRPYISESVLALGPDPFVALVGEIIGSAEREHAIFLVQVLLEGWGLNHYSWMSNSCGSESLRSVLKTILRDEARHHACGMALATRKIALTDQRVVNWLAEILHMVRIGPVRVIEALLAVTGNAATEVQNNIRFELGADNTTRQRLKYFRHMLTPYLESDVLNWLQEKRLFEPA